MSLHYSPRKDKLFIMTYRVLPANMGNSTVATGLEKVSFHSNPKERKCKEC